MITNISKLPFGFYQPFRSILKSGVSAASTTAAFSVVRLYDAVFQMTLPTLTTKSVLKITLFKLQCFQFFNFLNFPTLFATSVFLLAKCITQHNSIRERLNEVIEAIVSFAVVIVVVFKHIYIHFLCCNWGRKDKRRNCWNLIFCYRVLSDLLTYLAKYEKIYCISRQLMVKKKTKGAKALQSTG